MSWTEEEVTRLLDVAQSSLEDGIKRMNLPLKTYRKSRAVGTIRAEGHEDQVLSREQLDELALSCKHNLTKIEHRLPFCAFNGGSDVWMDIGNKLIGVNALLKYYRTAAENTLHVGDQFLSTGNDISTRRACCTVWVGDPSETVGILKSLLD